MPDDSTSQKFKEFFEIIRRLRDPVDGCPWDREQTADSLKSSLLEECYEAIDAISTGDEENLKEELGDIYLLVTLIGYIKEQEDVFTVAGVIDELNNKLVRRHPHIFGGETHFGASTRSDPDAIISQWEQIKVSVEGKSRKSSALDEVPKSLPPLERSYKLQKKAQKLGFDWGDVEPVRDKVIEELDECMRALEDDDKGSLEDEIGDLLFSVVNLSRFLKVDPAVALHRTNQKFYKRFGHVEREMKARGLPMDQDHLQDMDAIWNEAKLAE